MSKLYKYVFSDGMEINREATKETMDEIAEIEKLNGVKLVYNGFHDQISSIQLLRANSHKKKTDGFQPGYHPGLGIEVRSHEQYQSELKARGLIEVGDQKQIEKKKETKIFTDEIIKDAIDKGAELSGNEIAMLQGEF